MSTDWYRLLQIDLLAWLGYGLLTLLALGVWLIGRTHRRREMPVPSRVRRVVLVGMVILGAFLLPPLAILAGILTHSLGMMVMVGIAILSLVVLCARVSGSAKVSAPIAVCAVLLGGFWAANINYHFRAMSISTIDAVNTRYLFFAVYMYKDDHGAAPPDLRRLADGYIDPQQLVSRWSDYGDLGHAALPYNGPVDYGYIPVDGPDAPGDLVMIWLAKPMDKHSDQTYVARVDGRVEKLAWPQVAAEILRSQDWLSKRTPATKPQP